MVYKQGKNKICNRVVKMKIYSNPRKSHDSNNQTRAAKMLTMLIESNNGTLDYVQADTNKCILNLDVANWCWGKKSQHVNNSLFGQDQCPVCLDVILHDSTVLKLCCGHILHFECANTWFSTCIKSAKSAKCPLCNSIVLCPIFEMDVPVHQHNASNNETIFARIIRYIRGS